MTGEAVAEDTKWWLGVGGLIAVFVGSEELGYARDGREMAALVAAVCVLGEVVGWVRKPARERRAVLQRWERGVLVAIRGAGRFWRRVAEAWREGFRGRR